MQDGEDPRPDIAASLALIPAGNDALQAILYQVISHGAVAHLDACVPAKRWNQWLDHEPHVVHDPRTVLRLTRLWMWTPGVGQYSRRSHFLAQCHGWTSRRMQGNEREI